VSQWQFTRWLGMLFILPLLVSCAGTQLSIKGLAKGDIDLVADAHIKQADVLLRQLAVKLYKRNPKELRKHQGVTVASRLQQVFAADQSVTLAELNHLQSLEAIRQAFAEEFQGDRVLSLMVGLKTMLHKAYNEQGELFLLDTLDEQKLYNSARNLEIVAWRLSNRKDATGRLLLLTNSMNNGVNNLSYERLFGKLIGVQDMMAQIMAQRHQRSINIIVQKIASSILLPV